MPYDVKNVSMVPAVQGNTGMICYSTSDPIATVRGDGYFSDRVVRDMIDRCEGDGNAVPLLVISSAAGNAGGIEFAGLYNDSGTVKVRGGKYRLVAP